MRDARPAGARRSGQLPDAKLPVVTRRRTAVLGLAVSALLLAAPLYAQYPTSPPPPLPLRPVHFPAFGKGRLADGLDLIIVAQHKQPVVTVTLALQAGSAYDPPAKAGLASLVAELLTKGTETRSADQIAAEVEGGGGSIGAYADDDFLRITVSTVAENLAQAIDVLADVAEHSTFPAAELELARTRELSALQLSLSEPGAIAQRIFSREVYGDHPYGRSETPASVRAITRDDVLAFYRDHVRPGGGLLVVAGDVGSGAVRRLAARAFAAWHGAAAAAAFPPVPERTATEIVLVNKPGAVQSNILAGFPFISPRNPAVYPLTIMNQILGGGTDSRLFQILREQKGWTYGAYSRFTRPKGTGMFLANAEVRTAVTDSAVAELLGQLDRIRSRVPADSEIRAAKDYLVGSFPLTLQTPEQIAGAVASARLVGLPDDYVPRFRDRLAAVTAAQLAAADRRWLATRHMVVVVVGDAVHVLAGLKKLGPVRIVDVEGKAVAEADLAPAPTAVQWQTGRLAPGSLEYRVLVQGNPLGQATMAVARDSVAGRAVIRLTSATGIAAFAQIADTLTFDAATLAPIRVREGGTAGGKPESVALDYDGAHVKGHVHIPQGDSVRDADVDTTLAAGTLDDNQVAPMILALPLSAGGRWTVLAYSGSEGTVRTVTVSVSGDTTVTVPAGSFACWKVEAAGIQAPTIFYVTRTAPYLVAKYELVGAPISFELTKSQ